MNRVRVMRKTLPTLLVAIVLGAGFAQAGDLEEILKQMMRGQSAPAQPAPTQPVPPAPPAVPTRPAPPVAPAAAPEKPRDQLLKALLGGATTQEEEVRIGQQIAGNLLGAAPLVRDEALQRYVNRVGLWVALQSERPDLPWHFGVIDSDAINAFAAPGGYVFLTKGLYRKLRNEAELAGVLGHEIGHVLRQHHLKLLRQSQGIAALGGFLGRKVKDESELVQNLIGNGAEIVARGLDKDAEYEADRIGMVLTARAGYDVYALPAVLAEIGHVPRNDKSVSLLFKTHPPPADRLEHLAEAVGERLEGVPEGQSGEKRFYRLR
ncbi:MAG: TPR repeat-containing Zn-dependent protease [bacterium]|nr:MAG: TPR repeat-containing Zn-dependent protease [bacterium]KAF0149510.1 MAG: TPR repeat-containing Zn-dependent protease [bacterium]KAF0168736.1 MAG: TPR repeat-containing Zn-dependent protease [bacterium]TXT20434.1 MAG: TPR repeat-containing Zn-dependent protease [bacterium]